MAILAIDAGGTNLAIGLVEEGGALVAHDSVAVQTPTDTAQGYLSQVVAAAATLIRDAGCEPAAVALAMPGPLDSTSGIVFEAPNLGPWRNAPVREILRAEYGLPVTLVNDAEAAALGESWLGAGAGARCLVVYTLGTGVGGGILFDGRIWPGAGGSGGELGHVTLDPDGPQCGCGRRGCLEAYAGKGAIVRAATAALGDRLAEFSSQWGAVEPHAIARAALAGDRDCAAVFTAVGRALGLAMAGIVTILAPDHIVVCGGVAGAYELFAQAMHETIVAHTFESARLHLEISPGALPGTAGILGAARAHLLATE